MPPISFKRHRFPPDVIRHAVWLYFRFTLSLRDVEEMLAERGVEASYEAVRGWTRKFGKAFAVNLRKSRARSSGRWHLDEMVVRIAGKGVVVGAALGGGGALAGKAVGSKVGQARADKLRSQANPQTRGAKQLMNMNAKEKAERAGASEVGPSGPSFDKRVRP